MATVTASYNWVSGETVTPTKLNTTAAPTVVVADGEVTVAKLAAAVQQALLPAGAVQAFAMNRAPSGWLACDGAAVSRSTYAALFAELSTGYGAGDGSTTFNVPDLRGYFVRGFGTNSDGTSAGSFAVKQADNFKSHTHAVTDPGHSHNIQYYQSTGGGTAAANAQVINSATGVTASATTNISIQNTGDTETRPKNIAMLYCIKF